MLVQIDYPQTLAVPKLKPGSESLGEHHLGGASLEQGLGISISNKFILDTDNTVPGTHFEKHWYIHRASKPGKTCLAYTLVM